MTNKKEKKHIIFQSSLFSNIEDYKESYDEVLEENEYDEEQFSLEDYFYESINLWFDDEKMNLNKQLDNNIIALANLGLWNGRAVGYKELGSNLNNVMDFFGGDDVEIYFDGKNIRAVAPHHDGRNYILLREIRSDIDEEAFLQKVYDGKIDINNMKQLGRYTKPLNQVKEIYGW